MKLSYYLNKIADKLVKANNGIFNKDVSIQEKYLSRLHEPKDDIERSYYQYKCQMKLNSVWVFFAMNVASMLLTAYYLLKKKDSLEIVNNIDAVLFMDGKPINIIPNEALEKIHETRNVVAKKEYLDKADREFIKTLFYRHPFSFHFLLKCIIKIRFYSYEIHCCSPDSIIVCNEYSFTSSVMTMYCEKNDIKHINVMHGEKLYYMRDSFFRFHSCYVWDEGYINLFKRLRAEETQFKVAIPESFRFNIPYAVEKIYDYTYYLGAETGDVLKKIILAMIELQEKGYKTAIRPHPRYTDIKELVIKCKESGIDIENTSELKIEDSILRTKYAIAMYSTVLNQAYNNGTNIVIDDYSRPTYYQKLFELGYVMLNVDHTLLTELL